MVFRLPLFLAILAFSLILVVAGVPYAVPLLALALPKPEQRRRRRINEIFRDAKRPFRAVARYTRKLSDHPCVSAKRHNSAARVSNNRAIKHRERGAHARAALYRHFARSQRARARRKSKRCQKLKNNRPPRIITAKQMGLTFQWVFGSTGHIFRGGGHYSAGARARNATELVARVRSFHAYHRGLGWGGVSYPAIIDDDGNIALANPPGRKSAQVAGQNTGMIGICVPGTTGDKITDACARSIEWLLDNWHTNAVPAEHRIPRPARQLDWRGHREFPGQSTACPGDMLPQYKAIWRA